MSKPANIQERTFHFACRIIELVERIDQRSLVPRTIARQLLRSGTSVGANLEEACSAQSKADFIAKCSIAAKEARETKYWLRLVAVSQATTKITPLQGPLVQEAGEIVAILTTILKKAGRSQSRGM